MNKNIFLSMFCLVVCHVVFSQSINNNANPALQLKQLLKLPKIAAPLLHMPELSPPKSNFLPGFNIGNQMTEAKLLCPFVKNTATLQLAGDRNNSEDVGLHWETTNGDDNELFYVQRSLGDTLHFERINVVWATQKSVGENKYSLPDNNTYDGVSYYRLQLLLSNGSLLYSNTAPIKGYDNVVFALYPNPVLNKLILTLSSKAEGMASTNIFDAAGKAVYQRSIFINKGSTLQELDVTPFAKGIFTLKVLMPDKQIRVRKFIKM